MFQRNTILKSHLTEDITRCRFKISSDIKLLILLILELLIFLASSVRSVLMYADLSITEFSVVELVAIV